MVLINYVLKPEELWQSDGITAPSAVDRGERSALLPRRYSLSRPQNGLDGYCPGVHITGGIYEARHWDDLTWHDKHTSFHDLVQ
jgi:hypothetical protein